MKVILNALPPARTDTPSAALSILKGFLSHHGIDAAVIYWNILLERLLPPFERTTDMTHFDLLPYLYLISEERGDEVGQARANAMIKSQLPLGDVQNRTSDYLGATREALDAIVPAELSKHAQGGQLLFGISCKYEQWIPGTVLAGYIKGLFPDAKIVIGGFRNRDKAEAVMKVCGHFDYAIWGEGEYPLLGLCRAIGNGPGEMSGIERLICRDGDSLCCSGNDSGMFYDMNSGILPDYDDYFRCLGDSGRAGAVTVLPLESSRGCAWNACRFCVYGEGYRSRKKDPEVLKREVEHLLDRHGTPYFAFMDNDIVANDHERLEKILDGLASIRRRREANFMAEIIPCGLTAATVRKFALAGLERVHFGYESLSDRLLAKMRKRNTFADNILLVKLARRYGIRLPSANVICGAIGEEDRDILECIDNLHLLRFYLGSDHFAHNTIPLRIAKGSGFYGMVPEDGLARFDDNTVFHLLPAGMTEGIDRFSLFDFSAPRRLLWGVFDEMDRFYSEHRYSYSICREDGLAIYREYFDGEPLAELELDGLELMILQETEGSVRGIDWILEAASPGGDLATKERLVFAALRRLREWQLVYFNDDLTSIISVIDTGDTI